MPRKAKQRLDRWDNRLWESRAFLFSTTGEFDDWCRRIRARDLTKGLSRAAKFFHLDEKKREHRKLLLFILADVLFGDPPRVGRPRRPTKWGRFGLIQLRQHYNEVIRAHPRISDKVAAEKIREKFREHYQHVQADALRKRLPEARRIASDGTVQ